MRFANRGWANARGFLIDVGPMTVGLNTRRRGRGRFLEGVLEIAGIRIRTQVNIPIVTSNQEEPTT